MYTPLGIKTDYSILKSLIKLEDLISHAVKNDYSSLGILDDNLCSCHLFYEQCKKNNIKCIIGLDIEIDSYTLYLYPKNMDGLVNLFKLTRKKIDQVISIGDLKDFCENVICVLPMKSSSIYETITKIFSKVFISFKNDEEKLNAKLITDDIIYINDILALDVASSKYINYLYMIDNNLKLGSMELVDYSKNVLKHEDYDTSALTDLINIEFPTGNRYIPHYDASIEDSESYLRNLAIKGLTKRLEGHVTDEYKKRLNYELDVIANMGFTDYFLIVLDYVRFAIKNDIFVGAGRGSAAGSLVAYSLGITWIDPLKYDLLFERFLNPERVTMPDIDIDFEYERREEVIDYVKNRYGEKYVSKIMTFVTMTAKEVIRCVGKINDVDESTLNSLLKYINSKETLKNNLTDQVKNVLKRNSLLNKIYNESMYLEGIKKTIGTHPAGLVVSSKELDSLIPIIKSGDDYLTGLTMNELEDMGLIKMDFLAIRNLTILTNVLKDIEAIYGRKLNINTIPLDDKKVYDLFSRADTVGVFQFESTGLMNFLRRLKPTKFDDLVMALAIYRPGPMQNIDLYIDCKNNGKKVEYIDESLKPILESTYGILIYQEQIMEILRFMASYSYAEADIIRRAISKRKLEVIENERERFISNSIKNNHSKETAEAVFELIVKFASFGFNKSHSVAYAFIGYQMAYLKTYFKEIYYINLLNTNIGGEAKTREYIEEAKKSGIQILKPDINLSSYKYQKEENGIRLPLRVIKGVGLAASEAILKSRGDKPFEDFFDFMGRCYGFNVNKKTLEVLILAGVFDNFGFNRETLIKNIPACVTYAELIRDLDSSLVSKPELTIYEELPDIDLMNKEMELFGYYVSTHPASKYPDLFKQIDIASFFDKRIETVVLIENIKKLTTKNNKDMAFIKGSDETTTSEFVLFSDYFSQIEGIRVGDLVRIIGKVEKRYDKYQIIIYQISKI